MIITIAGEIERCVLSFRGKLRKGRTFFRQFVWRFESDRRKSKTGSPIMESGMRSKNVFCERDEKTK